MSKTLLIVESPTKAKTISKFLNTKKYEVTSSFGHIRDLPVSKMGIDIENEFTPKYVVPRNKSSLIKDLKKKTTKANTIIFATDEDREGEAIAWHLLHALKLDDPKSIEGKNVKRIVFHEITKEAIENAINQPRDIDMPLVDAQQARRILDRLVGYELSPFLWKAVARGLSAGRVQSAAVRLIAEREEEIRKFDSKEYWTIETLLDTDTKNTAANIHIITSNTNNKKQNGEKEVDKPATPENDQQFTAKLIAHNHKTLNKFAIENQEKAKTIADEIAQASCKISMVEKKSVKRNPKPPFTTSTLQQAANRMLGFSAKQTMFIAQQLYEGIEFKKDDAEGLITYMRTDSVTLSEKFIIEARTHIEKEFGESYVPKEKQTYKTKSKGAQEAHEAIRPTLAHRDPETIREHLSDKQFKLYKLIWQRAVASQMAQAVIDATTIDITTDNNYMLRATGQTIRFHGFMKVYPSETKEAILPDLNKDQELGLVEITPEQHFTQPPARYSEASLVKKLEELGIGRPSTYAPIISTIQDRNYVTKEQRFLKPTDMGEIVNKTLIKHFPEIVDYNFTAKMEEELDEIADGKRKWVPVIKEFYTPFKSNLEEKKKTVSKKDLEEKTGEKCEKCDNEMVIKIGRFGKFYACSGWPDCKNTKPFESDENGEAQEPEDLGTCPECTKALINRRGRFGPFVGCSGYPDCKYIQKKELKKTGVTCPKCEKGEIIEKRTRKGKTFYACSEYPKCDQAYWGKPTGDKCPECTSMLTATPKGAVKCSNKECSYKPEPPPEETA